MQNKALFLDRDGIINIDHGYVYKIQNFTFTQEIFELIQKFSKLGYLIFIVTNQSGIGRKYYTEDDFQKLTRWMLSEFKKHNINITEVYHCPHAPEENCHCRKPETGMIEKSIKDYSIDLKNSWMIGDKQSDIDLAQNAGIGNSIYIGEICTPNSTYCFKSISDCQKNLKLSN